MNRQQKASARRRPIRIAILVALCAAAAATAMAVLKKPADKGGLTEEPESCRVEKRAMDDIIEVSGNLKAREEQEIRAPSQGMVVSVSARAGDRVRKGAVLAALDDAEARSALERLTYEAEQERFMGNRRKVELLEREIEAKQRAVDELTIRAHIDGRISRFDLRPGDVLKAGDSYGRIIDVSSLVADVEIPEEDIPRAKAGQTVEFRFPAIPGLVASGLVSSFPAEARINGRGLVVLDVKLVIPNPPPALLPAYSFSAIIAAGPKREVLVADLRAIGYRAGKPFVERRAADGTWQDVSVETEGFATGLVRIVSGCADGDELKLQSSEPSP